jgi:hypothetical protein
MSGKGSAPRPYSVSQDEYANRWDAIFGKDKKTPEYAPDGPDCNPHPDAPHSFMRTASHSMGRYVCECEGWSPEDN